MSVVPFPSCDGAIAKAHKEGPATVASSSPRAAPVHSTWILATCILASSLAFIDGSVVNVGLPAIGKSSHESGGALAWVINGYLLPLGALLLLGGAAGDLYGRRRLLVLGTIIFAAASVLCSFSPGLPWLLAGRALQGIGAALLMPNSLAILGATFAGEARGRAIGIWAAVGAGAGAGGPLLGGWLIDAVGWRAIFLVNLPIAAGAVVLALRFVPDERDDTRAPLDLAGATLATVALGAATWALTEWSATRQAGVAVLGTLALGLAALAGFVVVERRRGERAMLPLALFVSSDFVGLTLLTFLLYGALGGLLVVVPYALIEAKGYTATQAGAALLPLPLVIALTSPLMGRLAGRVGSRWPLTVGALVAAAGCALALRVVHDGSYWSTVFPALLVISIGMAGAVAPLTTAVLASVQPGHVGVASGFNSAVARTGGLVATALLGAVLAAHGEALTRPFAVAVLGSAAAAFAAAVSAFVWVGRSAPTGA